MQTKISDEKKLINPNFNMLQLLVKSGPPIARMTKYPRLLPSPSYRYTYMSTKEGEGKGDGGEGGEEMEERASSFVGSPGYISPELLMSSGCGKR